MTISPEYRMRLVIMVKEPLPGRVKTRLGCDIGMVPAAWWFRHQSANLIKRLQDPRWQTILSVSPDAGGMKSRVWPTNLDRVPQGNGDIGQRMARIFKIFPKGPLIIVGADIPDISKRHITDGFATLGSNDLVFGPATDGGFWLVGMKRTFPVPPALFQNVRWSSEHTLNDCLLGLPCQRIALIDTLSDVDCAADLERVSRMTSYQDRVNPIS